MSIHPWNTLRRRGIAILAGCCLPDTPGETLPASLQSLYLSFSRIFHPLRPGASHIHVLRISWYSTSILLSIIFRPSGKVGHFYLKKYIFLITHSFRLLTQWNADTKALIFFKVFISK